MAGRNIFRGKKCLFASQSILPNAQIPHERQPRYGAQTKVARPVVEAKMRQAGSSPIAITTPTRFPVKNDEQ